MLLDLSALENWLWDAACAIRGPADAPKFKDYILPLEEAVVPLREAEEERMEASRKLEEVLGRLGIKKVEEKARNQLCPSRKKS